MALTMAMAMAMTMAMAMAMPPEIVSWILGNGILNSKIIFKLYIGFLWNPRYQLNTISIVS